MTLDNTFSLKEVTEEQEDIQEKDFKLNLNLELPLRKGEFGNKLKFGGKLVAKSKDKEKTTTNTNRLMKTVLTAVLLRIL